MTAIFSVFSGTRQLIIRELQDVDFNGSRCDGGGGLTIVFEEDFETVNEDQNVSLSGWTNASIVGSRVWTGDEFDGNKYARVSAFQDTDPDLTTWLITPQIELTGTNTLNFNSAVAFPVQDGLTVLVSSDFAGDPTTATWEELNPFIPGDGATNWEFVESGDIDLTDYDGQQIVIGFRYEGSADSGNTSTYLLDDIVITK